MSLRRTPIGIAVAVAAVLKVAVACGAPEAQVSADPVPRPEAQPSPGVVSAPPSPAVTVTRPTPRPPALATRATRVILEAPTAPPSTPAVVADTTPGTVAADTPTTRPTPPTAPAPTPGQTRSPTSSPTAAVDVAVAHEEDDGPTGDFRPRPGRRDRGRSDIPTCGQESVFFTVSPVTPSDFVSLVPLGNLAPPAHTFPTDHMYFFINLVSESDRELGTVRVPVYAPGDI